MKKLFTLSLFTLFVFTACKKDKNKDNTPSLNGNWTIVNVVIKTYIGGSLDDTDTMPGDGTTMDFQNNGNIVITHPGNSLESYRYAIKPDSKVEFDGDIYEVRDLTTSNVTLFLRDDYGPGEYDELYINLKR